MISAWFTTSEGTVIPALVPEREILEIAGMVGLSESDLFSIEIPSGTSREARVKVLVDQSKLATLYGGTNATATFWWKEATNATPCSMAVWLLPPKPVWMVAGGAGAAMVEAVDVRWWWRQTQINSLNQAALAAPLFSSDGRWNTGGITPNTTPLTFVTSIRSLLVGIAGTFTVPAGYNPNAALTSRFADHVFTPECSLAMALDFVLSATGWMLQYDVQNGIYTLVEVKDDSTDLSTWMASNKRAFGGGVEATSATPGGTDPLMTLWQSDANYQKNRMPQQVTVSFPYRSIEGKTKYDNTTDYATGDVEFVTDREFGWQNTLATARTRTNIGARVLKEPRSLVASLNTALNAASPGTNINGTSMPSWDYSTYVTQVMALTVKRCSVIVGQTAWAGWPRLPNGCYRSTMLRYSVGVRGGELVPFALTVAEQDDWILGPSGLPTNDPTQLTFSKGLAHARRLGSGAMQLDVAPPNTRVFPAIITGASAIGGETNPWVWEYTWQEVEPNPCLQVPLSVSLAGWARTGTQARNMAENGNVYLGVANVGNVVAPGVRQSDYTNATISALAISTGTIVHMVEQFPTAYTGCDDDPPYAAQYWFSMPNAVLSECNENAFSNLTLNGGTYIGGS
jgi:hypothetical protein